MILVHRACLISLLALSSGRRTLSSRIPVVTSSKFAQMHLPPPGSHVELPERVGVSIDYLSSSEYAEMRMVDDGKGGLNEDKYERALRVIETVHDGDYIDEVQMACSRGLRALSPWDSDTYVSKSSFNCFVLAQSAWLDCIDTTLTSKTPSFALSRPPGHHALKSRSCGFCVFNYAVGAAQYALEMEGVEKVSILDWDVHFGNGVSALVADKTNIRYASTHQLDIFPGGMSSEEKWTGPQGNLLNVGIEAGSGKDVYLSALADTILPFLLHDDSHSPDLLIVCAGYDALASDPMANVSLQPEDFYEITRLIKDKTEGVPICLGLEGGYNLDDLPVAIEHTLKALSENL